MTQIWVLYRQSGSDRLEKQPADLRRYTCYFGDRTLRALNAAAWFYRTPFYRTAKALLVRNGQSVSEGSSLCLP